MNIKMGKTESEEDTYENNPKARQRKADCKMLQSVCDRKDTQPVHEVRKQRRKLSDAKNAFNLHS